MIFLLKIAAGIFYGWLGIYYGATANMTDTWFYHASGLQEQQVLLHDPSRFLSELFTDPYEHGRWKFLSTENSYWNDLKGNAIIKGLAILDLITGGNYMVNVLFYNLLGMFGLVCFYRVLSHRYPTNKLIVGLTIVLMPSVLFWTSGIHKDGILFAALGMILYSFYFSLKKGWTIPRRLMLSIGLILFMIFRIYLLIALLPALLLWYLLERTTVNPIRLTVVTYATFIFLFFMSGFIDDRINLPKAVARKQQEFLQLKGKSSVEVEVLHPSPIGFIENTPQAIDLAFTRPHPKNVRHLLSLAAFLEVTLWGILIILWIGFHHRPLRKPAQPLDFFMLAFSISVMLLIGFSINNLGAIARYRSIVLIPLLAPLIMGINWSELTKRLGYKY